MSIDNVDFEYLFNRIKELAYNPRIKVDLKHFDDLKTDLMNVSMNQDARDRYLKYATISDILAHDKKGELEADYLEVLTAIDPMVDEYLEHIMRIYIIRRRGEKPMCYHHWVKSLEERMAKSYDRTS